MILVNSSFIQSVPPDLTSLNSNCSFVTNITVRFQMLHIFLLSVNKQLSLFNRCGDVDIKITYTGTLWCTSDLARKKRFNVQSKIKCSRIKLICMIIIRSHENGKHEAGNGFRHQTVTIMMSLIIWSNDFSTIL